ncbi:MAG: hypothetical protein HOP21_05560 [Methylotenera sp.]|nr:hypothetical protein [Methylotenera sp.]
MKLQATVVLTLLALNFNHAFAMSPEAIECNLAYEKGDFAKAMTLSEKALRQNKQDREALICKGRTLSANQDLNAALATFSAADALSTDALDKTVIALVISQAYKAAGQYETAIAQYQQTITAAQKAKHIGLERAAHSAIGDIHMINKQYATALTDYLAANKLDNNDNERAETNEKIAATYHALTQYAQAVEYQIKAVIMQDKSGTLDQFAEASILLGRYYADDKSYANAERALNKIIQFAKDQGGAYFEAKGRYQLAKVKAAIGDMAAAKSQIEQARLIAKNTKDVALDAEITQETQGLLK